MDSDKQDSDPLLFCIIKSQLFVDRKEFSGEYTLNMEEELEEKFYEKINIDGKWYEYLMTSSTKILRIELEKLGCRLPNKFDYRYTPYLSPEVREKMAERNATWSLTTSNDAFVLNYYKESEKGKGTPYIIYLSALADISTLLSNYDPKILNMFLKIGERKLPGISSDWSPLMIAVSQRTVFPQSYMQFTRTQGTQSESLRKTELTYNFQSIRKFSRKKEHSRTRWNFTSALFH